MAIKKLKSKGRNAGTSAKKVKITQVLLQAGMISTFPLTQVKAVSSLSIVLG
jgi:hypothetical protein